MLGLFGVTIPEIFNGECDAMVDITLIRPLNKGLGHSFWYQFLIYDFLYTLSMSCNFCSRMHRLATIYSVQADDRQKQHCNKLIILYWHYIDFIVYLIVNLMRFVIILIKLLCTCIIPRKDSGTRIIDNKEMRLFWKRLHYILQSQIVTRSGRDMGLSYVKEIVSMSSAVWAQ